MQPGQFAPRGEDWIGRELSLLRQELNQLRAANPFATMGITPKQGGIDVAGFINSLREDGTVSLAMDDSGAFVVYDGTGAEVARFGELVNSNPGEYGVEILYNGAWVQVGAGNVDWGNITNIPATFTPAAHTHAGGDVTSRVSAATDALGSATGWGNNVMGTEFYAVWVGNDGNFSFGRNTSSIRYKENVRDITIDPAAVLQLRPTVFDRKAQYKYPQDEAGNRLEGPPQQIPGAKNEFGLIAEEVLPLVPELVQWFDGEVDGVRYERGFVALLPVVKQQATEIEALRSENAMQAADIEALKTAVRDLGGNI